MTAVNLVDCPPGNKLIERLLRSYPANTFTFDPIPRSGINVLFGQAVVDRFIPGTNLNNSHCYPLLRNGNLFIPVFAPQTQFIEQDRTHWISHGVAKAVALANGSRTMDPPINYTLAPTLKQAIDFLRFAATVPCAVDIETFMETYELTAIAVATSSQEVISIPFVTYGMEHYWNEAEELEIWRALETFLATPNVKVFQNYIFDTLVLSQLGLPVMGELTDTLLLANLLNPELPKSLADLGRQYLFCEPWKDKKDFHMTGDPKEFWRYNAADAARTLAICGHQFEELLKRKLDQCYWTYTAPLLPLVLDSCTRGLNVDCVALDRLNERIKTLTEPIQASLAGLAQPFMPYSKRIRNKLKDLKGPSPKTGKTITLTKGYDHVQEAFNPNSNKQVKDILTTLGYKIPTKKGRETTDRQALLKLNRKLPHPFISGLLEYAKLQKLRSTYGSIVLDPDGRCRYSFNIGGTRSGRFSCHGTPWQTGINIQTIPRKNRDLDINFREIFIPDALCESTTLLQVDLSQAELRVVAWLSGEEKLIRMLEAGDDVHTFMSDEIVRVLGGTCDRNFGKFLNHSTSYGVGAAKLSDMALDKLGLSITTNQAQQFLDIRRKTFPRIYAWQDEIRTRVFRDRRLVSPHGRERYFYGLITDETIREALSFIPQATVVDVLNSAWILLAQSPSYNVDFFVHCQLHDALLITTKKTFYEQLLTLIDAAFAAQTIVINGAQRLISWDVTTGPNWGNLETKL